MLNLFRKEINKEICAPVDGECIPLEEVSDKVFSSKMMGDGFAIEPTNNIICAPIEGEIVLIPSTKHAFAIKRSDGLEVLVHIGIDTVNLNGKGFKALRKQGEKVKIGESIIEFDREYIKEKSIQLTTMVILTAGYNKEVKLTKRHQQVKGKEIIL